MLSVCPSDRLFVLYSCVRPIGSNFFTNFDEIWYSAAKTALDRATFMIASHITPHLDESQCVIVLSELP